MPLGPDHELMSEAGSPLIEPAELRYFDIVDTRVRADCLKEYIVPKLNQLLQTAYDLLKSIYGADTLSPLSSGFALLAGHV